MYLYVPLSFNHVSPRVFRYLLQHHLWLSSNAKTLLRLIPFEEWRVSLKTTSYPLVPRSITHIHYCFDVQQACNLLVTTCFYFMASRELYRLTMSLRGMLLPDSSARVLSHTYYSQFSLLSLF